jgi:hypothetical protein
MVRSSSLLLVVAALFASGCVCGDRKLTQVDPCVENPGSCDDAGVDAGIDAGTPSNCTDQGSVTGKVCAPDQATWVNGATVFVDATDCNGQSIHIETTSSADGSFTLRSVPPGDWTVHAVLGSFTQDTAVTVHANAPTAIPDNQLCVAQKAVRIAVVTGAGDKIENLLDTLKLTYTLYGGDSSTWTSQAAPFLADLNEMKKYDLIFVDCAAAKTSGTTIDLGTESSTIEANLHAYVLQGGSVYSSDWALLFTLAASPSSFNYATQSGSGVTNPLDAKQLMGFAPQTVTADVQDPALALFLGKNSLDIAFPAQSGHWGLLASAPGAQVLVSANAVDTCPDTSCKSAGAKRNNVPVAVRARLLPPGVKGGNVVYTSFHNVAQVGDDVSQVLKYLVLNL